MNDEQIRAAYAQLSTQYGDLMYRLDEVKAEARFVRQQMAKLQDAAAAAKGKKR